MSPEERKQAVEEAKARLSKRSAIGMAQACREASLQRKGLDMNIPSDFNGMTFNDYNINHEGQEIASAQAQAYATQFDRAETRGIIFMGSPGTGKSMLACCVVRNISMGNKGSARFDTSSSIVERIKATFGQRKNNGSPTEQDIMTRLRAPDLLIIDDVGRIKGDNMEGGILDNLICTRLQEGRSTGLTTMLSEAQLENLIGSAAYDRLKWHDGVFANMTWESWRIG